MADSSSRIAFVTGGNRGMGRAVVESLAADGLDVVFTYRSHAEEAAQAVGAVEALGRAAVALQLDTTDEEAVAQIASELRATLQQLWGRDSFDVLINNAGFSAISPLGHTTAQTIDELFAVHFKGVYLLTQALVAPTGDAAALLADGGRIVNLSTVLTRSVTVPFSVYSAVKGAVEVLTRYWAQELGARGISVNCIAPGPVDTDFADAYLRDNEQAQSFIAGQTALGRVAKPLDIGPVITAVVSGGTAWVTGQRIEATGGFNL